MTTALAGIPLSSRMLQAALALGAVVSLIAGMSSDADAVTWLNISWTASGAFALVGAWHATRRATGRWRRTWQLLAAGIAIWLVGQALWDLFAVIGFPASPGPADFAWLAFAVIVAVALFRLMPASDAARSAGAIEVLLLVAAVGSTVLALLFPALLASNLAWPARLTALAYPVLYVSVPVILAQVLLAGAAQLRDRPDLLLLFGGLVAEAIGFVLWASPLLHADYVAGTTVLDVLWSAGMLAIGVSGMVVRPGSHAIDRPPDDRVTRGVLPAVAFIGMMCVLIAEVLSDASLATRLSLQIGALTVGGILIVHFGVMLSAQRRILVEQRAAHAELQEAREINARFFSMSGDMLSTISLEGRFASLNDAWTETLGLSRDELLGQPFLERVHPDNLEHTVRVTETALAGDDSIDFENRYRAADGTWHWLNWQWRFSRDEQLFYTRAADVTERREGAQRLKELNRELEVHAGELERSNADLQRFAYVASHDLSEPLRTVSNFAQLLGKRYDGQLDERADRYIRHVVEGAERMGRLIEDLLTYSRVGQGNPPHVEVDTGRAVAEVLAAMRTAVEERAAVVTVGELPVVLADATQIDQIFQNLLSNALKFCDAERPEVQIGGVSEQDRWTFTVTDNGIGIDPKHAERIFQVFQRLHGRAHYEGTGIGLAVCKRAVQNHGGEIWAEPAPNGGTRFTFTVPFPTPINEVPA
jgi:PAS domain S-box-containing protein